MRPLAYDFLRFVSRPLVDCLKNEGTLLANASRLESLTKNRREFGQNWGHDAPDHMACGVKIVKNRIRQQYPNVF